MSSALTRALRVLADCLGSSTSSRGAAAAIKAVPPSARNSSSPLARATNAVLEPLEGRTMMSTTYYVSPWGNDANKGTVSSPWKTPGKVSGTHLNPGDHVLFQGGQTFYGHLNLYNDGGSSSNPVVIGSYGSGRPTINSGGSNGAWSLNSTGITFSNLKFLGSPQDSASQNGIRIENYSSNTVRSGFTVTNCDISGYGAGIGFGSDSSSEGLNNVSITNNNVYNNVMAGIESWAVNSESNTNVYIANNLVHNNYGDGHSVVTGSGIMLQGLNGATVERNSAYDNGMIGGSGNVGIWCYQSNKVIFQYNQAYDNRSKAWDDGDGFDFDSDVSNSIMQYNLSSNNDGGGFQLNQWWNDNNGTGDIVRYNISQNNGRRGNYAGIDVWGKVENAQIYNNTVYITPALSGVTQALRISNNTITSLKASNITIVGNIFVSSGGADLVNGYSPAIYGSTGIHFAGNVYYASGAFHIVYAGVNYTSLAAWEKGTGQEMLNGKAVGLSTNPMLKSVGQAIPQANAATLSSITAYNLLSGSPVLSSSFAAVASKALGTLSVSKDFLGNAVPTAIIAGVDESHSSAAVPTSTGTTGGSNSSGSSTSSKSNLTGWDIGSPKAGSNWGSGSNYTVAGGGADIWGNSDSFRYDFKTLSGNGTIIAKVAGEGYSNSFAKAGVMIRNGTSLSANAAEVSMLLEPDKNADFQTRGSTGGSTSTKEISKTSDQWVKLVRSGNTFSGYVSSNGVNWTWVGNSTVNMSTVVTIGLAVSSHDSSKTNTASFSSVAIT